MKIFARVFVATVLLASFAAFAQGTSTCGGVGQVLCSAIPMPPFSAPVVSLTGDVATCGMIGQLPCERGAAPAPAPTAAGTNAFENALLTALIPVVLAVGGMAVQALRRLQSKWGLEAVAQDKTNAEADLAVAMKAGISQVLPVIEQHGWNSPEAHDAIIGAASGYLKQRFPDRAAAIGASGAVAATSSNVAVSPDAAITQTLAARLPEAAAVAAASPATPPVADPPKAA